MLFIKEVKEFIASIIGITVLVMLSVSGNTPDIIEEAESIQKPAIKWLNANVNSKGLFTYRFNPVTGEKPTTNNELRQLMASRILAYQSENNPEVLELHKKNLAFIFKHWYKTTADGKGHVLYSDKSKLGGNAMLLRTLVYSPVRNEYEKQMQELVKGILSLQNPDGSFEPWFIVPEDYKYDKDYLLTFYSGEALLALAEYYEKYPQDELLVSIEKSADFYMDKYAVHLEENYYPAYVPWHTLAYNHLYKITGDKKYADAVFTMNNKLLEILDTKGVPGRFYNPATPEYGSPHSSSDAVYTEGLAYAYEVAVLVKDEKHQDMYKKAIELALKNLKSLQYRKELPETESKPEEYMGALKVNKDSDWIRNDTTQHAIDATAKIIEVFSK